MRLFSIVFVLLLNACAPKEQAFVASDHEATLSADRFVVAEDVALPSRHWLPKGKPKAIIVALHGFNDYSHAFEDAGAYFAREGIATFAYDQRGFGASPSPGIWAGEQNLIGDLKRYVQALSARYPKTPIYILGESMGGAVAMAALSSPDFPRVAGVILEAPAVWGEHTFNPIFRGTLWMAAHIFPFYHMTGSDLKILATDNIPMLKALSADPLVIKKTRIDAIYGMVHLMERAYSYASNIQTPVLLLYGVCDQVIPRKPIEAVLPRFTAPVTFAYYHDGYHMLLRDLQGEVVMADIVSWIKHPRSMLPSGEAQVLPATISEASHKHCLVIRERQMDSNRLSHL